MRAHYDQIASACLGHLQNGCGCLALFKEALHSNGGARGLYLVQALLDRFSLLRTPV
jgi:hypothetical protein